MLRSPFTFGGFGPSTLPDGDARRQSDAIRSLIEDAYKQGRSDGSRYGSIGGSQIVLVEASHSPSLTTSQLVRDQQGLNDKSLLWDETDVNFPPLPTVPPRQRDSEDSRAAYFVGEDLTTDADYRPENLQTTHSQIPQPDVQVQADVRADVHDPAATDGAAFLEPDRQTAATPEQTIEEKIRTFHISDDPPSAQSQTAPPAQNPDQKIAKKTYDSQKSSVTRLIDKFQSDPMLTVEDYNDLEQQLFALVNDMGLNFAKYLTLITISAELNDAEEDYRVRYTEAKSVLDNIADWRKNFTPPTSFLTAPVTSTSVAASVAAPILVAPPVPVATPRV
jgi:hypothetical protein